MYKSETLKRQQSAGHLPLHPAINSYQNHGIKDKIVPKCFCSSARSITSNVTDFDEITHGC